MIISSEKRFVASRGCDIMSLWLFPRASFGLIFYFFKILVNIKHKQI